LRDLGAEPIKHKVEACIRLAGELAHWPVVARGTYFVGLELEAMRIVGAAFLGRLAIFRPSGWSKRITFEDSSLVQKR